MAIKQFIKRRNGILCLLVTFVSLLCLNGDVMAQSPIDIQPVEGIGNFPKVFVAARDWETKKIILYQVEGNTATPIFDFSELSDELINEPYNESDIKLSPDGNRVAYRLYTSSGKTFLGTIDLQSYQSTIIDISPGGNSKAGEDYIAVTSFAWINSQELVYSKLIYPPSSLIGRGQIWLGNIDGTTQLLTEGAIWEVLGASSDGNLIYFTRLLSGREFAYHQGFVVFNRTTNEFTQLWPDEDEITAPNNVIYGFTLLTLPDGEQRIVYATTTGGQGPTGIPPTIWSGNPLTGEKQAIWEVTRGAEEQNGRKLYSSPGGYLWSPESDDKFIYSVHAYIAGVLHVDLQTEQTMLIHPGVRTLLYWIDDKIVAQNNWGNEYELIMFTPDGEQVGSISFSDTPTINQTPTPTITEDALFCLHQLYNNPSLGAPSGVWFDRYCAACNQSEADTSMTCKVISPLYSFRLLWIAWKLCSQL